MSPMESYVEHLLYNRLTADTIDFIVDQLCKLDWYVYVSSITLSFIQSFPPLFLSFLSFLAPSLIGLTLILSMSLLSLLCLPQV